MITATERAALVMLAWCLFVGLAFFAGLLLWGNA